MANNGQLLRALQNITTYISTIVILLLLLPVPQTEAQTCTFTNTGVNFGSVDLTPGTFIRTNGTFTATCTGTPGNRVRICMNFGSGTGGLAPGADPRYMTNGVNTLNYNIFKRNNYTRIWGSNVWPYAPRSKQRRVRLNGAGTGSVNVPIRTEIYAGQASTPPGLYTSSFAGGHTLISYAYQSVGNCNVISGLGGVQIPFTVQANVLPACTVSANNLDFGTAGVLAANQDATNTISVNCSNLVPYTISLDGGLTGAPDPALRKLANGPAQVTYGIYQDAARSAPWGDTIGTNTIGGTGTGSVQNYTAYGRVPTQTTPTPGIYTDTIVVTVTY